MRLWPWGLLLIGMIGVAAGIVVVTVTQSGSITVVQAGLIWVTPPNLASVSLSVGGTVSVTFTVQNNGGLPLSLSCSSNIPSSSGISVSCTGLPSTTLAAGAQLTADVVFTASSTATASSLPFVFTLSGSA